MVLTEATASPTSTGDTFPTDTSPTSDYDTYSTSNPNTPSTPGGATPPDYTLDLNKHPKPLPLIGSVFGFSPERRRFAILSAFTTISRTVQRPLTADECDAIAHHMAKGAAIHSYGEPLGLAGAYWRYNATRKEFRFPFWKPDLEKLNTAKLLGLRGARARVGWEMLRLLAYGGIGGWLGRSAAGAYATTVVAVGQASDPRLRQVKEQISGMGDEEVRRRSGIGGRGEMKRGMKRPEPIKGQAYGDQNERGLGYGGVQADGDVGGDDAESDGFAFDDASPTAGMSQAQSGGSSAWDKLRAPGSGGPQQSRPQQQQQQPQQQNQGRPGNAWAQKRAQDLGPNRVDGVQQEQRTGSTMGDAYAFSGSELERAEAKAQSQKEFDDRLDRERQGRDFDADDTSKRWR